MNAIVIAPTFLKSSCAVGQIERHFFPNLPKEFFSHIICTDEKLSMAGNNYITHIVPERKSVLKLDLLFRKFGLTDFVYSPDITYYSWCRRALKEASNLIEKEGVDYVHTINNPVSAHLVGYQLKVKYGIPWVAQFYDPWHNNPFRIYKSKWFKQKDAERESYVAKYADLIISPNQELLDSWVILYGDAIEAKSCVIPFTTAIPAFKTARMKGRKEVLSISHIGTLSEERRPDVFFKAVLYLLEKHPEDRRRLKVNIVGHIPDNDVKLITQNHIDDVINIIGRMPEEECYQYYESADVFLIVDINCDPNLFYPSKLLKYFCYKKPIVGLTQKDSVVAHELNKTGNKAFDYQDYIGLAEYIHTAIIDYDSVNNNDKEYYKRFLIENTTALYQNCINQIIVK